MIDEVIEDSIDKLLNENNNENGEGNDSLNNKFIEIYKNNEDINKNSAEKDLRNRPDSKFSAISSSKQLDKNSIMNKITTNLKNKNYSEHDIIKNLGFSNQNLISKNDFHDKMSKLIGIDLTLSEYNFVWSKISALKYRNNIIDENYDSKNVTLENFIDFLKDLNVLFNQSKANLKGKNDIEFNQDKINSFNNSKQKIFSDLNKEIKDIIKKENLIIKKENKNTFLRPSTTKNNNDKIDFSQMHRPVSNKNNVNSETFNSNTANNMNKVVKLQNNIDEFKINNKKPLVPKILINKNNKNNDFNEKIKEDQIVISLKSNNFVKINNNLKRQNQSTINIKPKIDKRHSETPNLFSSKKLISQNTYQLDSSNLRSNINEKDKNSRLSSFYQNKKSIKNSLANFEIPQNMIIKESNHVKRSISNIPSCLKQMSSSNIFNKDFGRKNTTFVINNYEQKSNPTSHNSSISFVSPSNEKNIKQMRKTGTYSSYDILKSNLANSLAEKEEFLIKINTNKKEYRKSTVFRIKEYKKKEEKAENYISNINVDREKQYWNKINKKIELLNKYNSVNNINVKYESLKDLYDGKYKVRKITENGKIEEFENQKLFEREFRKIYKKEKRNEEYENINNLELLNKKYYDNRIDGIEKRIKDRQNKIKNVLIKSLGYKSRLEKQVKFLNIQYQIDEELVLSELNKYLS